MSTEELNKHGSTTLSAIHFDVTADQLNDMREQYLPLVVTDFGDQETINAIVEGHKTVKKVRTSIESRRKSLNADALAWQRTVNSTAKDLTAAVQEVEDHLKAERDKVDAEKERIKREKEEAAQKVLQDRVTSLAAVGGDVSDLLRLRTMSDEDFAAMLTAATEAFALAEIARKAEEKRLAEEAEKALAEATAQQEAAEAQRAAEAKAQAEADAAREAELEAQRAEIAKQQAELAELRKLQAEREAAEAAHLAAEAKAKRLAEEAAAEKAAEEERKAAEEARLKREAELKPIREQLDAFASSIAITEIPESLNSYKEQILTILDIAANQIASLAD